jgi:hypothetical protein
VLRVHTVCNNHELTKSTNVIVDKDSDLAFAKRGTKWKCENGFHHKRAIKEIMKEQAANGVNTEPTDRNGTETCYCGFFLEQSVKTVRIMVNYTSVGNPPHGYMT